MENISYQKQALDKIRESRREKYLDGCRERLSKIAKAKIETSFIGALDAFEKEFGDLWGIKKENRTPEEQEWYEKWQVARINILNNGNNQLRSLLNEISNHVVEWNRYSVTFINKEN